MAHALQSCVLSNRCVTVYGPSGAGKSSLVQAAVLPGLVEEHDVRVALVDGWPEGENASQWLAAKLYADIGFGPVPSDMAPDQAILKAAQRAARRSERLLVVYLDQMEQLLYPGRKVEESDAFFQCIDQLAELPLGNVRIMLSLREDYLGRFRDRLRDRRRLVDNGFRVGALTVAELTESVCQTAAHGEPPQQWSRDDLLKLMLQVRVPGQAESEEAEVVAAYGQIVCRALFQQRAEHGVTEGEDVQAEPILRSYLHTTLADLGPQRDAAQRLLEEHLVTRDGSRTLRVETELLRILPAEELSPILNALERAAILHAGEHQGSRYFELGHDWLAKMINEQREEREREAEQQERLRRERVEAAVRLAKERTRKLISIAAGATAAVAIAGVLGPWLWKEMKAHDKARVAAEASNQRAEQKTSEARDANVVSGVRELQERGQLASAIKLLSEVAHPEARRGWVELASDAVADNALTASLQGHEGSLTAAVWSPDGKRVLTASFDNTARVWSADGKGDAVVLRHDRPVLSVAFSQDGKRIVTGSKDGIARVWPAGGGQPVELKGHEGPVFLVAFSPDGTRVLTAAKDAKANDGSARVFAAGGSGEPIVLKGDKGPPTCAAFHPDGARVFTGFKDGTMRLWTNPDTHVDLPQRHTAEVLSVVTSPDGKRVATASRDGTARVWDAEGTAAPVVLQGHEGSVLHAAFSADGQLVATASADATARVWHVDGKLQRAFEGHQQAVVHVAFRADGRFLATASADRTARLWPIGGGAPLVLREHEAPVLSALWSPSGGQVLTAAGPDPTGPSPDRTANVWNTERLKSLRPKLWGAGALLAAFIDASGQSIVSTHDDSSVRLWHVAAGGEPIVFRGHDAPVLSAALSSDGKRIVTASLDKTARVYESSGGEPIVVKQHDAEVYFAAFSPDGTRVVTLSADKTARVWNAGGSGSTVSLQQHEGRLMWAAWSPDGARIVTTSHDRTARIWDAGSGKALGVLRGHQGSVLAASFSPDGKRIATASDDRTARIWDAGSGNELGVLQGHGGAVLRVIWSAGGAQLATSSADKTVRVFSADGKGTPIVLETPAPVLALTFLDSGKKLLSVASDGTSHEWMIDIGVLRARLATAHTGCLSPSARMQYLGETEQQAREQYEKCERSFQRTPMTATPPAAPASAKSAAPVAPEEPPIEAVLVAVEPPKPLVTAVVQPVKAPSTPAEEVEKPPISRK